jgi:hypothetical protein
VSFEPATLHIKAPSVDEMFFVFMMNQFENFEQQQWATENVSGGLKLTFLIIPINFVVIE